MSDEFGPWTEITEESGYAEERMRVLRTSYILSWRAFMLARSGALVIMTTEDAGEKGIYEHLSVSAVDVVAQRSRRPSGAEVRSALRHLGFEDATEENAPTRCLVARHFYRYRSRS